MQMYFQAVSSDKFLNFPDNKFSKPLAQVLPIFIRSMLAWLTEGTNIFYLSPKTSPEDATFKIKFISTCS